jgi:hypothetical protein
MSVVGPGAQPQQSENPLPLLDRASEMEYVILLNPLTDDFAVRVAQDLPINMPFEISKDVSGKVSRLTNTEQDARQVYGLDLKNPDFQGRKHIIIDTIIKAGQTKVFKGNEAQVAIRQLVSEILQREGNKRLMADPNLRNEVETRIIQGRGPIQELMDGTLRTPRNQIDEAISRSNEEIDEIPTAGSNQRNQDPGAKIIDPSDDNKISRRSVGRPKKTDS